jgi:hypothetical protein
MQTVSHNIQLPYREAKRHSTATAIGDVTSALQRFPAELLVKTAAALGRAEDLQSLRLVSRAFSKSATTFLQSRFVRLHLMPTRTSMDRFTSLTMNALIAPKILQLVVIYYPPLATTVSSECAMIGESFGMSEHDVKDIVSEFNDTCAYSEFDTDAELPPNEANVVESGELERILGDGMSRLPALCSVSLRSDINENSSVEPWPSLNLPEFLRCGLTTAGNRFDIIKDLPVAEYARYEILRSTYLGSTGFGSPTNILGALERWPSATRGQPCSLSFLVTDMGSRDEAYWLEGFASRSLLLHDSMINITRIVMNIEGRQPPRWLTNNLDRGSRPHPDLALGSHWCNLLHAAVNLRVLQIMVVFSWSVGFDNLLNHIFKECTWSRLTQLTFRRYSGIKLLPIAIRYSMGWYLFLQTDLDKFLLRHKATLECLDLRNIVGVKQKLEAPPWTLQHIGFGFPECPIPSLPALSNSLDLWVRELGALREISVILDVQASCPQEDPSTALEAWLRDSELQALATALGIEAKWFDFSDQVMMSSRVMFDLADAKRGTRLKEVSDSRIEWAFPQRRVDYM